MRYFNLLALLCLCITAQLMISCEPKVELPKFDYGGLTSKNLFDRLWYDRNVPLFECSDKRIEAVYYYRWELYRAHLRSIPDGYVITEFINHVSWDRDPFCTINAASMHHIYEGRWLKDQRYMNGYIDYLYQQGGNDRRYSESIADAAYARYLVNADSIFLMNQFDSMRQKYDQWSDHWEASKNLYYIPAMPDATEYTIASIDGSGGTAGFDGGEAFRPTINSYMYGNALAISRVASMKGEKEVSAEYAKKAASLKSNVEQNLWNDSLHHFLDRFKMDNQYVHYWDFIRGRELAGLIPWYFNLPDDNDKYNAAWNHVKDTTALLGKYGLRTNEPSYEYYFKQFVFFQGQRGSQWNGPSWPYQTSQVLTAMANVLNNYHQQEITNSDYLKILKQFTEQHYLPNGKLNLVENYDPNLGGPIVYYYWSNHYNHSSYNNLIITGLCGIRPSEGDTLLINPLVDDAIQYFYLKDVLYHGHRITVVYDQTGSKYNIGKGLTVFVDDHKAEQIIKDGKAYVMIGKPTVEAIPDLPENIALNIKREGYPTISASVNTHRDSVYQVVDGRMWHFSEISNRWTTEGSKSDTDWIALDFGKPREVSRLWLYTFVDSSRFGLPTDLIVEYLQDGKWLPTKIRPDQKASHFLASSAWLWPFEKITTNQVRVIFKHTKQDVAITEIEFN